MINKVTYFLEKVWLVFGVVSLGLAVYRNYKLGFKESYMLYIIAFVSFAMFIMRYSMRKKNQK